MVQLYRYPGLTESKAKTLLRKVRTAAGPGRATARLPTARPPVWPVVGGDRRPFEKLARGAAAGSGRCAAAAGA